MNKKHGGFTIKVSDILHNSGVKDTISFTNKFSTLLPQIVDPGMSCKVTLISLSNNQLMVEVTDTKVPLKLDCDYCGKTFKTTKEVEKLVTKASVQDIENDEFEIDIDDKMLQMDIEKWLLESIIMRLPVAKICKECEEKDHDKDDETGNIGSVERDYQ